MVSGQNICCARHGARSSAAVPRAGDSWIAKLLHTGDINTIQTLILGTGAGRLQITSNLINTKIHLLKSLQTWHHKNQENRGNWTNKTANVRAWLNGLLSSVIKGSVSEVVPFCAVVYRAMISAQSKKSTAMQWPSVLPVLGLGLGPYSDDR